MRVVHIHLDDGIKTAIMGEPGRVWTQYVMIDYPVCLRKIANGDVKRYVRDIPGYPLKKALRHYNRIGRHNDITRGAKQFLRNAAA